MRITRRDFLALLAVAPAARTAGVGAASPGLREWLKAKCAEGQFPGAALIASRKGSVVLEHHLGTYCRVHKPRAPLGPDVRHPLFSYSKLVSATVVGMARDAGEIEYDSPVTDYIPEFKGGDKERITIRHLLTHSAGIPNVPLGAIHNEVEWQNALRSLCAASLEWEPGSKTQYHALSGMLLAAEAVRRVSAGESWETLCRRRLFEPLGAPSLSFQVPDDTVATVVTPPPQQAPEHHGGCFGLAGHPAAGCFGTVADALKVLNLHLQDGVWNGRRLLSSKALREMHTVQFEQEIHRARKLGKEPAHEPWGLGLLLRGPGPAGGSHAWFGIRDPNSPGLFGHAGLDTIIAVADPMTQIAFTFATTASPGSSTTTIALRNEVTNRVLEWSGH